MMKIINTNGEQFITKSCTLCQEETKMAATDEQIQEYQTSKPIQDVFPTATANEREIFISGICGKCFDNIM